MRAAHAPLLRPLLLPPLLLLLMLLLLLPATGAAASSSPPPIDVQVSHEGSGAVGEAVLLRLTWRVSPNLEPPGEVRLEVPDWVEAEGATNWMLRSERDREWIETVDVTLRPTREGYWRAGVRGEPEAPFAPTYVLTVRSENGGGAIGRHPEDVMPRRAATADAALGEANATHAEVIVRGAKGEGWRPHERLALAPAGQGHLSTVEGDAGEHREAFLVPENHALSFQPTAYVEATFDGPLYEGASRVAHRPVTSRCAVLSRDADGTAMLEVSECRYPGTWRFVPMPSGFLFAAALAALALSSVARRDGEVARRTESRPDAPEAAPHPLSAYPAPRLHPTRTPIPTAWRLASAPHHR